jgi:zinc protease
MPNAALFDASATQVRRLANGLTVLVSRDRSAPVVAIVTYVRAGYFDEPDHLVGISHVLEHMFFKGTPRLGPGEIARETKAAGGYLNAGTIYDRTSYYTVLPSDGLEAGLEIQADALINSVIDAEELRKELLVIIQEAKRKLDNPAAVAHESLFELLFDRHRIRRWRIGTESALAAFTRDDVWSFYRSRYRPEAVVLSIVGDVDSEQAFSLVEKLYGGWSAGDVPPRDGPEEPPRRGFRLRELAGDTVQTHLEWGWRTPGTLHEDTPALETLAIVLGQGRASRLYREVRETGHASVISAYNYTPTDIGVFGISAELAPERTRSTVAAIAASVQRLLQDGVTEAELERARNIMEARFVSRLETMEGQANVHAEWQSLGDWRLGETYHARLLAVTAEDLVRVARRHLQPDLGALMLYRPRDTPALGVNADALHDELYGGGSGAVVNGESSVADELAAEEAEASGATGVPAPPSRRPIAPDRVDGDVRLYRASNGVRIVVLPRRSVPLVSMAVSFRGGSVHETAGESGVTALLARTSIKGTLRRSGRALAEATEALGGAISASAGADLLEWDLALPSRHFDTGLALLAETVLEPVFPEAEVMRERAFALEDMEQIRDDMQRFPMRLFLQRAFDGHPYGYSLEETERAIGGMDGDMLATWHAAEVLAGEPWVVVVGDVDADAAAAAVESRFAGLRPAADASRVREPIWPADAMLIDAGTDKNQTAVVVGFPGPRRNDYDRYALQLFSNVIGGLGGPLFEELRSRRSLAYSVTAYPIARWLAGAFVGYIATSPEREDEAREGLISEITRYLDEPLDAEEVERAKRYTIGTWRIRRQTNGAHVSELVGALMLGGGLDDVRDYAGRIEALTPEAIRDVVRCYIDPARAVTAVVRGAGGGR